MRGHAWAAAVRGSESFGPVTMGARSGPVERVIFVAANRCNTAACVLDLKSACQRRPRRAEVQLREAWHCTTAAAVLPAPAAMPSSGAVVLAAVEGMLQAVPLLRRARTRTHAAGLLTVATSMSFTWPRRALAPNLVRYFSGTTLSLYCRTTNMSILSRALQLHTRAG